MAVYARIYPPPPGEEPKPINWKASEGRSEVKVNDTISRTYACIICMHVYVYL
jgi:hypothetical protein